MAAVTLRRPFTCAQHFAASSFQLATFYYRLILTGLSHLSLLDMRLIPMIIV